MVGPSAETGGTGDLDLESGPGELAHFFSRGSSASPRLSSLNWRFFDDIADAGALLERLVPRLDSESDTTAQSKGILMTRKTKFVNILLLNLSVHIGNSSMTPKGHNLLCMCSRRGWSHSRNFSHNVHHTGRTGDTATSGTTRELRGSV